MVKLPRIYKFFFCSVWVAWRVDQMPYNIIIPQSFDSINKILPHEEFSEGEVP